MARILVVEDNEELAFGLTTTLEIEGHEVVLATSGPEAIERASAILPDLILLDVMLPGFDGFRVLRTLREAGVDACVLMLTAKGQQEEKVRGLRLGADDYVTKPFGAMELLARVDALLRRAHPVRSQAHVRDPDAIVVRIGATEIFPGRRLVRRHGQVVTLTPKSYDLLMALVAGGGVVVSRRDLLRNVWGYEDDVTTRTVDLHIAELRRKLEDDSGNPAHILTVFKVGYRLER
jgi:two-component system alkaline phosphatase synthesis response regulator PhoP